MRQTEYKSAIITDEFQAIDTARAVGPQINGWFVGCVHVEKAVMWCKEMRACTHKCDNSGFGVIILEKNLVQIGLIIAEILFFGLGPHFHKVN